MGMHSRTILLCGISGLVCLICAGAVSLHVLATSGSSHEGSDAIVLESEVEAEDPKTQAERLALVTKLEGLLDGVLSTSPDSLVVTSESVAIFARVIQVIDSNERFDVRLTVTHPTESVADWNTEVLRNAVLLNVRRPERLSIVRATGAPGVMVDVTLRSSIS